VERRVRVEDVVGVATYRGAACHIIREPVRTASGLRLILRRCCRLVLVQSLIRGRPSLRSTHHMHSRVSCRLASPASDP